MSTGIEDALATMTLVTEHSAELPRPTEAKPPTKKKRFKATTLKFDCVTKLAQMRVALNAKDEELAAMTTRNAALERELQDTKAALEEKTQKCKTYVKYLARLTQADTVATLCGKTEDTITKEDKMFAYYILEKPGPWKEREAEAKRIREAGEQSAFVRRMQNRNR
tara:strand:- start:1416 stop:1913 length:498 start_codon:yes stop_codon:yes gene_type:complete